MVLGRCHKEGLNAVAIVGSGPSIADLRLPHELTRNRICMAIHRGVRYVPSAHMLILFDNKCPTIFAKEIELFKGRIVRHRGVPMQAEVFENIGANGTSGASLGFAMEYALTMYPGTDIELYGVDLMDGTVSRGRPRMAVPVLLERLAGDISITNCCPSTKYDYFPIESRPWTRNPLPS